MYFNWRHPRLWMTSSNPYLKSAIWEHEKANCAWFRFCIAQHLFKQSILQNIYSYVETIQQTQTLLTFFNMNVIYFYPIFNFITNYNKLFVNVSQYHLNVTIFFSSKESGSFCNLSISTASSNKSFFLFLISEMYLSLLISKWAERKNNANIYWNLLKRIRVVYLQRSFRSNLIFSTIFAVAISKLLWNPYIY